MLSRDCLEGSHGRKCIVADIELVADGLIHARQDRLLCAPAGAPGESSLSKTASSPERTKKEDAEDHEALEECARPLSLGA